MKISLTDRESAQTARTGVAGIPDEEFRRFHAPRISRHESPPVSTDLEAFARGKLHVHGRSSPFARIGMTLALMGKRILDFAPIIIRRFPNTSIGLVLALAISLIVSTIPLLGGLLGGFALIVGGIFFGAKGLVSDLHEQAVERAARRHFSRELKIFRD